MDLPTFETERLLLRPYTLDDAEVAFAVNCDPEVSKYSGDGGVKTREEMGVILRDHVIADYAKYGYGRYAVVLKESAEYIGFSGLKYLADVDSVDMGYRFAKKIWGQGIATESCRPFLEFAFQTLGLKKLIGVVMPENTGSVRVLEKLGFSLERQFVEDGVDWRQYQLRNNDG